MSLEDIYIGVNYTEYSIAGEISHDNVNMFDNMLAYQTVNGAPRITLSTSAGPETKYVLYVWIAFVLP